MKNFSQFIYETGTGSGTYSGAAAQETGERRSEELRKKLQSIKLGGNQSGRKKTVVKKYGDTVQKKPESKKPKDKKPEAISGTPKRKALPPAKPQNKTSVAKKSVDKIKTLSKSPTKTKSTPSKKPQAISGTPERKALPPAK